MLPKTTNKNKNNTVRIVGLFSYFTDVDCKCVSKISSDGLRSALNER
jgi:hypothetical protein